MKATEAARLTSEALNSQASAVGQALQWLFEQISKEAAQGKTSFSTCDVLDKLNYEQRRALEQRLKSEGYKVSSSDNYQGFMFTVKWDEAGK